MFVDGAFAEYDESIEMLTGLQLFYGIACLA